MKTSGIFIVISALLVSWIFIWSREARVSSLYRNARLGQNEAEILEKIGEPDQVLPCGEFLWWNGDQFNPPRNKGQCVKWVRYNFYMGAYAFGYSADGKLVSRYNYISE